MPVGGVYEMSSTVHNGHSTWESTLNGMVLFKGTSGAWQFDRTIESDTENDDNGDCPSSAKLGLHTRTFSVQIAPQDGLFMTRRDVPDKFIKVLILLRPTLMLLLHFKQTVHT